MNKISLHLLAAALLVLGCESNTKNELPVLGRKKYVERQVNGQTVIDTVEHTIAPFEFYNQDSVAISNQTYQDKIYVADFFFTSCPTICPVMKKQMLRVYEAFEKEDKVQILSHTIDPEYDNVSVLKAFADAIGVASPKWNFVTGDREEIYEIGESSYMVTAGADENAPGGYIHSGAFILVDGKQRIRGVYDGTMADQVDILISDIKILLSNQKNDG